MTIRFDGRVALVTGAGTGLGRSHALGLASRGAKVVVNDLGTGRDGRGPASAAAAAVAREIEAAGGSALADGADVTDQAAVARMVERAMDAFGRIDIVVNNAGILRDKTFGKVELEDFRAVLDVHLMGSVTVTRACWPHMRAQGYGRVVFTSSSSGLYGNFGQSAYAAAKAGLVGLAHSLHLEGRRDDIRVNVLSPAAATRMTEGLFPAEVLDLLAPETITPGLLYLVSEDAPSRTILAAGGGTFARALIAETPGVTLADPTPEAVAAAFDLICSTEGARELAEAFEQTRRFGERAGAARGIPVAWDDA